MIKALVVLTGAVEQKHLIPLFRRHNSLLTFYPAATLDDLAALPEKRLEKARLIAFCTDVIVPAAMLERLGGGAYNFHPASPDYPGISGVCFAKYDGASHFGATLHRMTVQVDAGPIIDYELFDVPSDMSVETMSEKTYAALVSLMWRYAGPLANGQDLPVLPDAGWGDRRTTRKMFTQMCEIPLTIDPAELKRRVEAFGVGNGQTVPTLTLHGVRFRLQSD